MFDPVREVVYTEKYMDEYDGALANQLTFSFSQRRASKK